MSDPKQARVLLAAASRDLKALTGMMDSEIFADEIFGFHVQQAAEKSMKAWLACLGEEFPYTHDLGLLLQKLEDKGCEVSQFWDLLDFNLFAVQLRYDALIMPDEPVDRQAAIKLTEVLYSVVDTVVQEE
jgi:HEPN domain-containing protein